MRRIFIGGAVFEGMRPWCPTCGMKDTVKRTEWWISCRGPFFCLHCRLYFGSPSGGYFNGPYFKGTLSDKDKQPGPVFKEVRPKTKEIGKVDPNILNWTMFNEWRSYTGHGDMTWEEYVVLIDKHNRAVEVRDAVA